MIRVWCKGVAVTLLAAAFATVAAGAGLAQTASAEAELQYRTLWFQCVSSMQVLALRPGLNARHPTADSVAGLLAATDSLETAVSGLMRSLPPADSTTAHVTMLPRLQEIVAAARDAIDAIQRKDAAAEEASLQWLDDALRDANATFVNAIEGRI